MRAVVIWGVILLSVPSTCVASRAAPEDPYRITAREKAACTNDAIRFCAFTYPDTAKLLDCMKTNRSSLSPMCLSAFDAGLKRRHMN